jgi:hypothetical protein
MKRMKRNHRAIPARRDCGFLNGFLELIVQRRPDLHQPNLDR